MPALPARPDLDQLRHRARDLLAATRRGEPDARTQILAVSDRIMLAAAQLAVARSYGFPSWTGLKTEVTRRDHPLCAAPLTYLAMLRHDTSRQVWRDVPGTAAMARVLLAAGRLRTGTPTTRRLL